MWRCLFDHGSREHLGQYIKNVGRQNFKKMELLVFITRARCGRGYTWGAMCAYCSSWNDLGNMIACE